MDFSTLFLADPGSPIIHNLMAFSKKEFGVGEGGIAAFSHPKFLFAPALGRGLEGGEKQGFRL